MIIQSGHHHLDDVEDDCSIPYELRRIRSRSIPTYYTYWIFRDDSIIRLWHGHKFCHCPFHLRKNLLPICSLSSDNKLSFYGEFNKQREVEVSVNVFLCCLMMHKLVVKWRRTTFVIRCLSIGCAEDVVKGAH